jgi:glycerol-3-phosphate acyltransferase PlsX
VDVVAATQVVEMTEDPVRALRRKRDSTVRVAAGLVRDGRADATVSIGSTGAALAAAVLVLGRLPGMTRAALAPVLPSPRGPVVLIDAGANADCTVELLQQFAVVGAAYARVRLGVRRPRVGLLSIGEESGKGDTLRKKAEPALADVLADGPAQFVGNVEGHAVALGGEADVVVCDGFTGNVLLKGIEGALAAVAAELSATESASTEPNGANERTMRRVLHRLASDESGAVLLGVDGVSVVGHGAASPAAVAGCIALAAAAAEERVVPRVREALAEFAPDEEPAR